MKYLSKIALINIGVLLAYSAIIRLLSSSNGRGSLGILVMSAYAVVIHVIVCLVIYFFYSSNKQGPGNAWLWSSGIVLLVGFSTCLGNASL